MVCRPDGGVEGGEGEGAEVRKMNKWREGFADGIALMFLADAIVSFFARNFNLSWLCFSMVFLVYGLWYYQEHRRKDR